MVRRPYAVLASLSGSCPPPPGRFVRVTHPSATKAEAFVRLACIRHAANVYPEPGSNSPKQQTTSRRSGPMFIWFGCQSSTGHASPHRHGFPSRKRPDRYPLTGSDSDSARYPGVNVRCVRFADDKWRCYGFRQPGSTGARGVSRRVFHLRFA